MGEISLEKISGEGDYRGKGVLLVRVFDVLEADVMQDRSAPAFVLLGCGDTHFERLRGVNCGCGVRGFECVAAMCKPSSKKRACEIEKSPVRW